jgi:exopolyphosphatase/guanosine-5'-triphosphate,3'-diphosphate pyrophosphatase
MNIASIDIGSNTILMLITEIDTKSQNIKTLRNEYRTPRLGRGLTPGKPISDESLNKMYDVFDDYFHLIEKYDCKKVIASATNALRIASNANEIIADIKKKYSLDINVLSGEEEAEYSFLGASTTLPETNEKIVVDIGGGSTELIYGKDDEIIYRKSFPVGAVSITEEFVNHNPPLSSELEQIESKLNDTFSEIRNQFPKNLDAIAVAGTPTTLACINQGLSEYVEDEIEGAVLTQKNFEKLIDIFSDMRSQNILKKYGKIVRGREDVILEGTMILNEIMNFLELDKFYVSGKGIRYGAVVKYLKGEMD